MRSKLIAVGLGLLWVGCGQTLLAQAQEPGWSPYIIGSREFRAQIEQTPILERPYRPLHFYGNTVRRQHYRGFALPLPQDVVNSAGQSLRPRNSDRLPRRGARTPE